jgi:hypothetical protein
LLLELERGRKTVGCSSEQTWGGGGGVGHGRGCLDPVVIGLGGGRRKDVTKKERKKGGAITSSCTGASLVMNFGVLALGFKP